MTIALNKSLMGAVLLAGLAAAVAALGALAMS